MTTGTKVRVIRTVMKCITAKLRLKVELCDTALKTISIKPSSKPEREDTPGRHTRDLGKSVEEGEE